MIVICQEGKKFQMKVLSVFQVQLQNLIFQCVFVWKRILIILPPVGIVQKSAIIFLQSLNVYIQTDHYV